MRISDWSSDVCSSDLAVGNPARIILKETRHPLSEADPTIPGHVAPTDQTHAPATPTDTIRPDIPAPCETGWDGKPLQDLLLRNNAETSRDDPAGFAAYAVNRTAEHTLIRGVHALPNTHTRRDQRIGQTCPARKN